MAKIVLGVFETKSAALDALITLEDNGYSEGDIQVVIENQLPGLGLSGEDIKIYRAGIKKGKILFAVSVQAEKEEEVKNILLDYGAQHLKTVAGVTDKKTAERKSKDESFAPAYYSRTRQLPNKSKKGKKNT